MDFQVLEVNHGMPEDVLDRFSVLLEKRAITGIDETKLDRWIPNFHSDEEHYNEFSRVVRRLVSVDDMLGMVTQFDKLAKEHALPEKEGVHIVHCPLIAHAAGLKALKDTCPWLIVLPAEVFVHRHNFFSEQEEHPGIWVVCAPKIKPQLMP